MKKIATNLKSLKEEIPAECTLVAVSKTKPSEDIKIAYQEGQRDFGENKVQELVQKAEGLPKDINWHMVGHLQRNKVKYITPFVYLIHGVDSLRLLLEIQKQAKRIDRKVQCLLQIHIAKEETKFGFSQEEINELVTSKKIGELSHVQIMGIMGMASNTLSEDIVHEEFKSLKQMFEAFKSFTAQNFQMKFLSMGMSGDFKIALSEGSNMIRIGSTIFGSRNL